VSVLQWSGETPDLLALKSTWPERYPALFCTRGGEGWDILFAFPQDLHMLPHGASIQEAKGFFQDLPQPACVAQPVSGIPFTGGWLMMLSYEMGGVFEPSVGVPPDAADFPLAWALRIPAAILTDRRCGKTWLIAETGHDGLLEQMAEDLRAHPPGPADALPEYWLQEDAPAAFLAGVKRIQSYIREGDVFQVNLSRGWQAAFSNPVSPCVLFRRLRACNPAPFSAVAEVGGWAVVSSSPERLIRLESSGKVMTRPIAGTHPRGETADADNALKARLAAHPKERAEHIMLVDLERNDLGRVCAPGSVKVEALMELASYAHVHHLESTVSGQLKPGVSLFELIRAVFPGGTITGCPKVRTMQIVRELEEAARRTYTGSLGYVNMDGTLDLNILIRSFLVRDRVAWFRTGAGIVADSDPERELAETRAKAKGLLGTLISCPEST
jgi:anthranilate synthase component I